MKRLSFGAKQQSTAGKKGRMSRGDGDDDGFSESDAGNHAASSNESGRTLWSDIRDEEEGGVAL